MSSPQSKTLTTPMKTVALETAAALTAGVVGGWIASKAGLPLPWMIGAMLLNTLIALSGIRLGGHTVRAPMRMRLVMVPVIGVMLGSSFTPELLEQMRGWWLSILVLALFVAATIALIYPINRHVFGLDKPTAYFSSIPGGVIEAAVIGELAGGDARTISLIHFCRIIIAVLSIPIAMRLIYGPVGSAAIDPEDLDTVLSAMDVALLVAAGIVGFYLARALKLPGAPIVGPMLLSALVHVTGLTAAHPPSLLVIVAQIVMGTSLGARFVGYSWSQARTAMRAAATGMAVMLALASLFAYGLSQLMPETFTEIILAFAPGGLAEMSLIALSLNIGVAFVATHHVVRILFAMLGAPIGYKLFIDRNATLTQ